MKSFFIYYVEEQSRSLDFYTRTLLLEATMNVPGMLEFTLPDGSRLGFMPEEGIKNLLGTKFPDPSRANGIPRAEIYLVVDDAATYHARALANGAIELKSLQNMPWGDRVAYSLDPDGHVLAFAEESCPTIPKE